MEIALVGDVIAFTEMSARLLAKNGLHFRRGEEIVSPLNSPAVRILSGEKAAAVSLQLPETIVQGAFRHTAVQSHVAVLPSLGIQEGEQGVVIECLFKMGGQPFPVRGIAGEAPAEVVENSSTVHLTETVINHLPQFLITAEMGQTQEEQQVVGRGELGGCTKATVFLVIGCSELLRRSIQPVRAGQAGRTGRLGGEKGPGIPGGFQQAFPVPLPFGGNSAKQGKEPCLPAPAVFGNIGSGEEGKLFRGHDNGEGPAAAAGESLAGFHIYTVHIRALFPVHLHWNKISVQKRSHLLVLKALPGHYMAPVTGGIAYRQENGLVLTGGPVESFLSPRQPIHRIFRMLPEIGGFFLDQTVAHATASKYLLC